MGLKRIKDLVKELERIRKKIEIAGENGAKELVIERLLEDLEQIKRGIGDAAVAEN